MTNVNFIGSYPSLAALWKAHPEGGIEGDYVLIGESSYYGWDKFSRNWVATTISEGQEAEPAESETETQEETTVTGTEAESEEDIPAPNAVDINYLGSFASLADVWFFFPEGGTQGDYVAVDGTVYSWDKYTRNWAVSENKTITISFLASTPSARTRINYLGAFDTLADVWFYYPEGGYEGDYIHIGEDIEVWNKWNREWGESAEPVSPAITSTTFDGDLEITHNLTVAGTVKAAKIIADAIEGGLDLPEVWASLSGALAPYADTLINSAHIPDLEVAKITGLQALLDALNSAISELKTSLVGKYTKPAAGIPESDLSEDVQALLNKSGDMFLVVDENGSKAVKLNPKYTGLWAEGFISSRGKDDGGGSSGGGGASLEEVWASLTGALAPYAASIINAAHIPDLPISKITALQTTINTLNAAISAKYTKPDDGIPESDLSQEVQELLSKFGTMFTVVEESGVKTVKLNPEYAGLWAEGFISSRGKDGSGSSGGGTDLEKVWESLKGQVAPYENETIDAVHIPSLEISKITGLQTDLDDKASKSELSSYATKTELEGKADLVNGSVPVSQLPASTAFYIRHPLNCETLSDGSYRFELSHGMGKRPTVTVTDAEMNEVKVDVQFPDDNTVVLTWSGDPLSGGEIYLV